MRFPRKTGIEVSRHPGAILATSLRPTMPGNQESEKSPKHNICQVRFPGENLPDCLTVVQHRSQSPTLELLSPALILKFIPQHFPASVVLGYVYNYCVYCLSHLLECKLLEGRNPL